MSHPYQPPESELDPQLTVHPTNPTLARAMALLGWLVTGAFFYAIVKLINAFNEAVFKGTADEEFDAPVVSEVMAGAIGSASISLLAGMTGLLIMLLTAVFSSHRTPGFFRLSMFNAVLYLLAFPIGSVVSVLFIGFLIAKRREFFVDDEIR